MRESRTSSPVSRTSDRTSVDFAPEPEPEPDSETPDPLAEAADPPVAAPSELTPSAPTPPTESGTMSLRARIGSTMSWRHTVEAAMSEPEAVDIIAARAAASTIPPSTGFIEASTTATNTSSWTSMPGTIFVAAMPMRAPATA